MYSPVLVMVPGPLTASPPFTFQVTSRLFERVVAKRCTLRPSALVALHPVQFVSIEAAAGDREKLEPARLAEMLPPLHPANRINAGASSAKPREYTAPRRELRGFTGGIGLAVTDSSACPKFGPRFYCAPPPAGLDAIHSGFGSPSSQTGR